MGGKKRFIESRVNARATASKAAETANVEQQRSARRSMNRARLDLYRNKLKPGAAGRAAQQPMGTAQQPMGRAVQPKPTMGTAQQPMGTAQPQQPDVQKFNLGGIVQPFADPNMSDNDFQNSFSKPPPPMLSNTPYTESAAPMREDTRFLTYKDGLNDFDPNKKEIPLVHSPEERKSQQAIAPVAYEDKYGGFGGSGKTAEELKEPTPAAPSAKKEEEEEEEEDFDAAGAMSSLASAMKPKEQPEATQYKSFTVDDNSAPVKDVMSARREALMNMMNRR